MEADMEVDMVAGRPRGAMEVMEAEVTVVATAGARRRAATVGMVEVEVAGA